MSAGGWGYAIAAAINGGLKGMQLAKGWEQQEEDAAFKKEERAQQRQTWADASTEKQVLKDAAQPIAVQQYTAGQQAVDKAGGAEFGPPQIDVSQVPANPAEPVGFKAGKQSFMDQTAAQRYADEQNTPMGIAQRQVDAYTKIGKPKEAMAISTQILQQREAEMKLADKENDAAIGKAVWAGPTGIASYLNDPKRNAHLPAGLAGKKLDFVQNQNGTLSLAELGQDGALTPIAGVPAMTNDVEGAHRAMVMLSTSISPEKRYEMWQKDKAQAQTQSNWVAAHELQKNQDRRATNADERATAGEVRAVAAEDRKTEADNIAIESGKIDLQTKRETAKMSQVDKLEYDSLTKSLNTIDTAITKAQVDGTLQPDSPGVKSLLQQRAAYNDQMQDLLSRNRKSAEAPQDVFNRGSKPSGAGGQKAPNSYKDPAWDGHEAEAAKAAGIPVDVLRSVRVNGERSNGDQVSPKGAKGVYQFIPATRDAVLKKYGYDAYSPDPRQQALAAAALLKEINARNGGDWSKTFAGYNGGISGEQGTNPTRENREYVQRTMTGMLPIAANNMVPMYGGSLEAPEGTAVRYAQQAAAAPQRATNFIAADQNSFYGEAQTAQRMAERKARDAAEEKAKAAQKAAEEAQAAKEKVAREARRAEDKQRVLGNAASQWR